MGEKSAAQKLLEKEAKQGKKAKKYKRKRDKGKKRDKTPDILIDARIDPMTGRLKKDSGGRTIAQQGASPPKSMDPKQIRARARRRGHMLQEELDLLYKPVQQWDPEELAKGYPRNANGKFPAHRPTWINRTIHEEAVTRFQAVVKGRLGEETIPALDVLHDILTDNRTDDNGKPLVPAGVKVDIAKFLVEHVIGKPKQVVEQDVSVKLQAILAVAMVNPTPGVTPTSAGHGVASGIPGYILGAGSAPVIDADLADEEDADGSE